MSPPSKLTPEPVLLPPSTTLHEVHNTFHLLYHRNKNQHRCAKWFKHLSLLRRNTRKLAVAVEEAERLEEEFDERVDEVRESAGRLVEFFGGKVVGRCYWAFSTVVADTQFSALGVVLIAQLARLSKVIGAERYFPAKDAEDSILPAEKVKGVNVTGPREDLGEIITRDQLLSLNTTSPRTTPVVGSGSESGLRRKGKKRSAPVENVAEDIEPVEVKAPRDTGAVTKNTASIAVSEKRKDLEEKKRKKKKRKANAIDDIFGGL